MSTLRFVVTVTLAWAIFFIWLVLAAHAERERRH
jgi:hypothetical protein